MPNISEIADNYVRDYSFMAVNATKQFAMMLFSIHADDAMIEELHQVHDELIRRGMKPVMSKDEYDAGVAEHGVPPAFIVDAFHVLKSRG